VEPQELAGVAFGIEGAVSGVPGIQKICDEAGDGRLPHASFFAVRQNQARPLDLSFRFAGRFGCGAHWYL
jgi:hypothetical protein